MPEKQARGDDDNDPNAPEQKTGSEPGKTTSGTPKAGDHQEADAAEDKPLKGDETTPKTASGTSTSGSPEAEVTLRVLAALRRVAVAIAEIADKAGARTVVLGALPSAADLALYDAFEARISYLLSSLEDWMEDPADEAPAADSLSLVGGLAAATSAVEAAAKLASYFKVELEVNSVQVEPNSAALNAVVAGALVKRGINVLVSDQQGLSSTPSSLLIDRLLRLVSLADSAARSSAGNEERTKRLEAISASVEALSDALLKPGSTTLEGLALLESARARAAGGALSLAVSLSAFGGSKQTYKSLWTSLFSAEPPRYGGAAAVSFTLSECASGKVLASDVLYAYARPVALDDETIALTGRENLGEDWKPARPSVEQKAAPTATDSEPQLDAPGTYNPIYCVTFESLTPGGFYSADPDDLRTKRSIRTNNPGALNVTSWQRAFPGFVAVTKPDGAGNVTAIYRTPEHGIAAWYNLLTVRYGFGAEGQVRVGELARRYAGVPSENDAAARTYIAGWGRHAAMRFDAATVVRLNQTDDVIMLALAMFGHEIGGTSPLKDDQVKFAVEAWRGRNLPQS